jgi:hypothetical protein
MQLSVLACTFIYFYVIDCLHLYIIVSHRLSVGNSCLHGNVAPENLRWPCWL